jgi:DNA primase
MRTLAGLAGSWTSLELTVSFIVDADTKERVRAATDIVDLVGSFIEVRRQGRGFVALCPWHHDRRPSLQVNPERQTWKCWVCDIGGDVFNFVMQYEGVGFPDALKMLAERAGVTLDAPTTKKGGQRGAEDKTALYRLMAWASRLYHQHLLKSDDAAAAREYLVQRGITSESIEKFEIGLAPSGWSYLIGQSPAAGYNAQQLDATGMIVRGDRGHSYDRFRERLMFPIRDTQKRVIAFGGRILPGSSEAAKYINSPESRIFTKNQHLYGLDVARDSIRASRQAIVMEGYTDVIVAHQCGLDSAVAVLGTALGANHLKLLHRNRCERVVLLLDGDEAGQRRSDDVLELFLNAQMDVRVLTLPDELDPADFLLQRGADELHRLAAAAPDALEFKMRRVCEGFDPLQETHRATTAMEQMLTLLSKVPRSSLIADEAFLLRRNQVLARLSKRFLVAEDELRNRLRSLMDRQSRIRPAGAGPAPATTGGSERPRAWENKNRPGQARPDAARPGQARSDARPAGGASGVTSPHDGGDALAAAAGAEPQEGAAAPTARLLRPGDLTPVERELLELVISAPNLAPMVLERVLPEWITCEAAKRMLETYHELELDGHSLEFDSVLVTLEDPSLKSLMVTLYEQAQVKQQFVRDTPEQRLRVLTQRLGQQQEELQRRRQLSLLEDGGLDDETELNLLSDFIRQARQSHGLDEIVEDQASISEDQ